MLRSHSQEIVNSETWKSWSKTIAQSQYIQLWRYAESPAVYSLRGDRLNQFAMKDFVQPARGQKGKLIVGSTLSCHNQFLCIVTAK